MEDVATDEVMGGLQGYNARVVTLTMGCEVSGEVAHAVVAKVEAPAVGDEATTEDKREP